MLSINLWFLFELIKHFHVTLHVKPFYEYQKLLEIITILWGTFYAYNFEIKAKTHQTIFFNDYNYK